MKPLKLILLFNEQQVKFFVYSYADISTATLENSSTMQAFGNDREKQDGVTVDF
jgi:hypothetical protein